MNISRENYETWFTDWFDNRLTGAETEELNFFLDQNPDLREEFTDLCAFSLKPPASTSGIKEKLKKNPSEIPAGQFELLCAASVENDLDSAQAAEVSEIIKADPEKAIILEIYKRLKLNAPEAVYQGKRGLMKKTVAARVVRMAWIGLSAAAVVSFLLMTDVFRPRELSLRNPVISQASHPETRELQNAGETVIISREEESYISNASDPHITMTSSQPETTEIRANDGSIAEREAIAVPEKLVFYSQPAVLETSPQYLAASSITYTAVMTDDHYDERSNVGKFLARHFRSKVLDEELPSDAPLKAYEIAEAGIEGLNKLLGWEMDLTRNTDEKGEPESVKFNSRMLKFNAPVKNNWITE